MAKATGFMEYERKVTPLREVEKRIRDWNEIKESEVCENEVREQAARCMDCGVPFCHSGIRFGRFMSGCPLHNLMPEINEFVYRNLDEFAYRRLAKTNNFPEFTSHVCPALCEGACSVGLIGEAVSVKNIEKYLIDKAFENGWVKPNVPVERKSENVAVIGSGPSGLACADELNKYGYNVTVFERADRAGGLLMYGIPNMKLEKELIDRRVNLLKEAGIKFSLNSEVGVNISATELLEEYDAIVLCTGSTVPRDLPAPGRDLNGIYFAKDYLVSATKFITKKSKELINAKGKNVVIIGGGDTGTDCVATAIRQGCKSVRQLEIMPCLPRTRAENNPWPEYPRIFKVDYGQEEAIELYGKDPREYCITTKSFLGKKDNVEKIEVAKIKWENEDGRMAMKILEETTEKIDADIVLLAMGFVGSEEVLFREFSLDKKGNGSIATTESGHACKMDKIFAAGDARNGQSLVVEAMADGKAAAKNVDEYLTAKKK